MAENVLRWPLMDGTYLEVVGCLGAAFKIVDGFGIVRFGDWVGFGTRECERLWGEGEGRGAERTDGFKQVLPSDVNT